MAKIRLGKEDVDFKREEAANERLNGQNQEIVS